MAYGPLFLVVSCAGGRLPGYAILQWVSLRGLSRCGQARLAVPLSGHRALGDRSHCRPRPFHARLPSGRHLIPLGLGSGMAIETIGAVDCLGFRICGSGNIPSALDRKADRLGLQLGDLPRVQSTATANVCAWESGPCSCERG